MSLQVKLTQTDELLEIIRPSLQTPVSLSKPFAYSSTHIPSVLTEIDSLAYEYQLYLSTINSTLSRFTSHTTASHPPLSSSCTRIVYTTRAKLFAIRPPASLPSSTACLSPLPTLLPHRQILQPLFQPPTQSLSLPFPMPLSMRMRMPMPIGSERSCTHPRAPAHSLPLPSLRDMPRRRDRTRQSEMFRRRIARRDFPKTRHLRGDRQEEISRRDERDTAFVLGWGQVREVRVGLRLGVRLRVTEAEAGG